MKATVAAQQAAAQKAAKAQKLKAFQTALKARLAEYKRPGAPAAEGLEPDVKGIRCVGEKGRTQRRTRVCEWRVQCTSTCPLSRGQLGRSSSQWLRRGHLALCGRAHGGGGGGGR